MTTKRAPRTPRSTRHDPPLRPTSSFTTARPMPVPAIDERRSRSSRTYGSQIRSRSASGTPGPSSSTARVRPCVSALNSTRADGGDPPYFHALSSRLVSTCRSASASTATSRRCGPETGIDVGAATPASNSRTMLRISSATSVGSMCGVPARELDSCSTLSIRIDKRRAPRSSACSVSRRSSSDRTRSSNSVSVNMRMRATGVRNSCDARVTKSRRTSAWRRSRRICNAAAAASAADNSASPSRNAVCDRGSPPMTRLDAAAGSIATSTVNPSRPVIAGVPRRSSVASGASEAFMSGERKIARPSGAER